MESRPFIDPKDIERLKQIQRLKLTLPIRNLALKTEKNLTDSIRKTLYDFFHTTIDNSRLIDTLRWFIFKEYDNPHSTWILASCPLCEQRNIFLRRSLMSNKHVFICDECKGEIFLTDVFRLHEVIDDELGAGGILGYITTTIEQILLVHLIRLILSLKPALLNEILFIKDGPLAFFGQTANMFKPMRELVGYLFENHNLFLAGLEKSGSFVEHADEIANILENGSILILDNDYIYKYILPGKADPNNPYGRTTYYSNKLIFKSPQSDIHVVSLPTSELLAYPSEAHLKNMHLILQNIDKLRCDMYDSSLVPVALVNKLVSLANHPSMRILQKFAIESVSKSD